MYAEYAENCKFKNIYVCFCSCIVLAANILVSIHNKFTIVDGLEGFYSHLIGRTTSYIFRQYFICTYMSLYMHYIYKL